MNSVARRLCVLVRPSTSNYRRRVSVYAGCTHSIRILWSSFLLPLHRPRRTEAWWGGWPRFSDVTYDNEFFQRERFPLPVSTRWNIESNSDKLIISRGASETCTHEGKSTTTIRGDIQGQVVEFPNTRTSQSTSASIVCMNTGSQAEAFNRTNVSMSKSLRKKTPTAHGHPKGVQ